MSSKSMVDISSKARFEKIERGSAFIYELSPLIYCYMQDRLKVVVNAKMITAVNLSCEGKNDYKLVVSVKGGEVNIHLADMDCNESEQALKEFTDIWQYIVC